MQLKEHRGALDYLTLEPDGFDPGRPYPAVVLLHGYGAGMTDLVGLGPSIGSRGYLYAFPNAPIKLPIGFGAEGYAWGDLIDGEEDDAMESSAERLDAFFHELAGSYRLAPGRAVLGGFSQGGMMAYRCGLTDPVSFRGVAALSARIPDPAGLEARLPSSRSQSVFVTHGTNDPLIPLEEGRRSRGFLEAHGYNPDYREYEMGHEINQEVLEDLTGWIAGVLTPADHRREGA